MSKYETLSCDNPEYYKKLGIDYDEKNIDEYKSRNDFLYLFLDPQFKPRLYYNNSITYLIATVKISKQYIKNNLDDLIFSVYTTLLNNVNLLFISSLLDDSKILKNEYCTMITIKNKSLYIDVIQGMNTCGFNIKKTFICIFYIANNIFNVNNLSLLDTSQFEYKDEFGKEYDISTKFIRYFLGYPKELISIYNIFGFNYKETVLNEINIPFPNTITIKELYDGFKEIKNKDAMELCDYLEKNLDITFKQFIKEKPDLFNIIYIYSYNKLYLYENEIIRKLNTIYTNLSYLTNNLYLELPKILLAENYIKF